MSFEGYYQILCKNGHYHCEDCYSSYGYGDTLVWRCPECQEQVAWENLVDITNGTYEQDEEGNMIRIDGYIELQKKTEALYEECPTCKVSRLLKSATYHIPGEEK